MRFHMIDYVKVTGNANDGWKVGFARVGKRKFCCRNLSDSTILDALHGWGVLPNSDGFKVVDEGGQFTIFESKTEKPICAIFRTVG